MASEAEPISPAPARTTGPRRPDALHLREVEPADGQAVHALLTANIPGVLEDRGRWLRRWQWQYWDNPFRADRPAGWVLTDGDHIVGHLGAVYVPFRVGSRTNDRHDRGRLRRRAGRARTRRRLRRLATRQDFLRRRARLHPLGHHRE